jgi:hypothetical protein
MSQPQITSVHTSQKQIESILSQYFDASKHLLLTDFINSSIALVGQEMSQSNNALFYHSFLHHPLQMALDAVTTVTELLTGRHQLEISNVNQQLVLANFLSCLFHDIVIDSNITNSPQNSDDVYEKYRTTRLSFHIRNELTSAQKAKEFIHHSKTLLAKLNIDVSTLSDMVETAIISTQINRNTLRQSANDQIQTILTKQDLTELDLDKIFVILNTCLHDLGTLPKSYENYIYGALKVFFEESLFPMLITMHCNEDTLKTIYDAIQTNNPKQAFTMIKSWLLASSTSFDTVISVTRAEELIAIKYSAFMDFQPHFIDRIMANFLGLLNTVDTQLLPLTPALIQKKQLILNLFDQFHINKDRLDFLHLMNEKIKISGNRHTSINKVITDLKKFSHNNLQKIESQVVASI